MATAPPEQPRRIVVVGFPLSRILMIIAFACFIIAALMASGAIDLGFPYWGMGFGGFAAVAGSWSVP